MVTVNDNNIDKALKKFQKKIREKKLFNDIKKFEFYEKPSVDKNKKKSFKK
jgi:ribosomal protein S21